MVVLGGRATDVVAYEVYIIVVLGKYVYVVGGILGIG